MADYYSRPLLALCDDGKARMVSVRHYWDGRSHCLAADTFFSVPASVKYRGKHLTGYVTTPGGLDEGQKLPGGAELLFHAHNHCDPWRAKLATAAQTEEA